MFHDAKKFAPAASAVLVSCDAYAGGQTIVGLGLVLVFFVVWLYYRLFPGAAKRAQARDDAMLREAFVAGREMVELQQQFTALAARIRSEHPLARVSVDGSHMSVRQGDRVVDVDWTSHGFRVSLPGSPDADIVTESAGTAYDLVREQM